MSLFNQLCERLLNDLNLGIIVPRKDKLGNWEQIYIPYQDTLKSYCLCTVPRNIFLAKYPELPPIENFPAEEKAEWKKFVNDVFPGTTPQFRLEAVKIIYTIGTLMNEQ